MHRGILIRAGLVGLVVAGLITANVLETDVGYWIAFSGVLLLAVLWLLFGLGTGHHRTPR